LQDVEEKEMTENDDRGGDENTIELDVDDDEGKDDAEPPPPTFEQARDGARGVEQKAPREFDESLVNRKILFKWIPGGWWLGTVTEHHEGGKGKNKYNYEVKYETGARDQRLNLNLYCSGDDDDDQPSGSWSLIGNVPLVTARVAAPCMIPLLMLGSRCT